MSKPAYNLHDKIKIVNETGLGNQTKVMIGDTIIPVIAADIRIRLDELIEIDLVVRPGIVDIEALQEHTMVTVEAE